MAHLNYICDADVHFTIDPITRAIKNASSTKTSVIQYDHNSERFTFTLPRYIEGHDMMECNHVAVHYINASAEATSGLYIVEDMHTDETEENVLCSWLLSQNVTQNAGLLHFLLRFSCVADDGTIEYAWNTGIHKGISVESGMNNSEKIVEKYADILAQWEQEMRTFLANAEAPKDGAMYARKDGAWVEVFSGLPEISMEDADNVFEGVYLVKSNDADVEEQSGQNKTHILVASYSVGYDAGYDANYGEIHQMLIDAFGDVKHRFLYSNDAQYTTIDNCIIMTQKDFENSNWSENDTWRSILPNVSDYALKSYVDAKVKNASAFKTICSGALDENWDGVGAISAEITEDISAMREFHFYIEFPATEENAGTTAYVNANISGSPAGSNSFFSVNSPAALKAGTTYSCMAISEVLDKCDGQYILSFQRSCVDSANNGTNARGNALVTTARWNLPKNTTLYLNINNNVAFLSGTKWRLEGR